MTSLPLLKHGIFYGKKLAENVKHLNKNSSRSESCKPDRGKLPWETDQKQKLLDWQKEGIECNECRPQSLIDQFKSILERRRIEKCKHQEKHNCQGLFEELTITRKTYPQLEAERKGYLPGCPVAGWQLLNNS
ncbi:uncharacterized protein LOC130901368 [Diorhabda carinulata]|uniref:uncharacterized protein LOC130901368 n=1 Tax=Diorhabda carinulata TaxID=1163345 RepID=UPI0025A20179|nr:uncharacterized protein LOC130901368 [Diorhabda carinulata]